MIRVTGRTVAAYLRVDFRPACLGVLILFKDEYPAALSENKTASFRVERYGSPVHICGACYRVHIVERSKAEADIAVLRAARYRRVEITVLDGAEGFANRLRSACTCRGNAHIASFKAHAYRHLARRHISYHFGDGKHRHLFVSFVMICQQFLLGGVNAADSASYYRSHAKGVEILKIRTRVRERFHRAVHSILNDNVAAPLFLFVKIFRRVKVFHPRNNIETVRLLFREPWRKLKAVPSRQEIAPKLLGRVSARSYRSQSRYYNSSVH